MEMITKNKLMIIGASGHGKVALDIALLNGYKDIIFLDDNTSLKSCSGYPVVGKVSDFVNFKSFDVFVAIGDSELRKKICEMLDDVNLITLIHPSAVISRQVDIDRGTIIMAGAIINSDTRIGKGSIINTAATVDHDCIIADFVHVSVGAHVAGNVTVDDSTWLGAGSVVINNLMITSKCIVGAGAVVVKDLTISGTYVGVPAAIIKYRTI